MKKKFIVTFKDGRKEEYLSYPDLAEGIGIDTSEIRYLCKKIESNEASKLLRFKLDFYNISNIDIEERQPMYKVMNPKERYIHYRGIRYTKMTPEEAAKAYTAMYGGNWKYSEKHKMMVSDQGILGSLFAGKGLLSMSVNNNGYARAGNSSVHKIVWETFKGEVPVGYDVDHIDNDKRNNKLENLQLLTHKENIRKRDRNGTVFDKKIYCFLDGKLVKEFPSQAKAAEWIMESGISGTDNPVVVKVGINLAATKKTTKKFKKPKKAYGFQWSYSNKLGE
jgi:hypothetical protein